jgi:EamA-like transporter family
MPGSFDSAVLLARFLDCSLSRSRFLRRRGQPDVLHDRRNGSIGEPCRGDRGHGIHLHASAGRAVPCRKSNLAESDRHDDFPGRHRGPGFREWPITALPSLSGDAIALSGAVGFATYGVLGKPVAGNYAAQTMTGFNHFAGVFVVSPLAVYQTRESHIAATGRQVSWQSWVAVLYMAILSSAVACVFYFWLPRYPGGLAPQRSHACCRRSPRFSESSC